jgi:hypothetical protein
MSKIEQIVAGLEGLKDYLNDSGKGIVSSLQRDVQTLKDPEDVSREEVPPTSAVDVEVSAQNP